MPARTAPTAPPVLDGDLDPSRFAHLLPSPAERAPSLAELVHQARTVAADQAGWRHLVRFDAAARWRLRLHAEPAYEVWLMSWLPGQRTGLHDHGDATALIAVAYGELHERSLVAGQAGLGVHRIGTGQVRIWGARNVREIVNGSAASAVSVHVYTPPLRER